MARYPAAIWEPISGGTDGPIGKILGLVLHVNDSDGADLFNWEQGGAHNMSSHFQVAKDGRIFQYLDTSNDSWCQADGNNSYLSVETEGYPTEALTEAQVQALAGLVRWVYQTHGMPLVLAEQPGQPGFGWHGMGGSAWGGHTGCPGDLRKAQRQQILNIARGGAAPAAVPDWFDMATKADLEAVVDERLQFYLPRLASLLLTGEGNRAFNVTNAGALVDNVGLDGRLKQVSEAVKAVHPAAGAVDPKAVVARLGDAIVKGNI